MRTARISYVKEKIFTIIAASNGVEMLAGGG
jgi:hypothetical protein